MNSSDLGARINTSIQWIHEDNWSVVAENTDIWDGELPYKPGMRFPTPDIIDRAMISKTNRMIYENEVDEIYNSIISILPEVDPTTGWQIREIVSNLPYFKNATNAWVGLVAGDTPLIDIKDEKDLEISELLEGSNFAEIIQSEVRSRFLDIISAYRVDIGLDGRPRIIAIESKNLICFVSKECPTDIEVNVVFSIYKDESNNSFVDFVEYHYNGKIVKHTYEYANGTIGRLVRGPEVSAAFEGRYQRSPITVFRHNIVGNEIYGTDQYRYWYPSMMAGMREFQNVLRLGERTREMLRKVPDSAIRKNPYDGSSSFLNQGTLGYNENSDSSPDVEYIVPEVRMQEAISSLNSAVSQIGTDTQLSSAFFNLEKLGSRLSAESIEAALYPAKLEAKRMTTEMKPSIKDLVIKLGLMIGVEVPASKISVSFYDGFPRDELSETEAVHMRLGGVNPSINLVDAIMKLDRVPLRVAKQKAAEILGTADERVESFSGTDIVESTGTMRPSAGSGASVREEFGNYEDDTVWDNQFTSPPRDIPQGVVKEVSKQWTRRKILRKGK